MAHEVERSGLGSAFDLKSQKNDAHSSLNVGPHREDTTGRDVVLRKYDTILSSSFTDTISIERKIVTIDVRTVAQVNCLAHVMV